MMKKSLIAIALVLAAFVPTLAAQTAASLTGKWEGTFKGVRPDGTEGNANAVVFNLTQKGKVLTGTGGPADKQWPIAKGAVAAGKATFEIQQPDGPLYKFTLALDKGHLTGDMVGEKDGQTRQAKVDVTKAKDAAKAK